MVVVPDAKLFPLVLMMSIKVTPGGVFHWCPLLWLEEDHAGIEKRDQEKLNIPQ